MKLSSILSFFLILLFIISAGCQQPAPLKPTPAENVSHYQIPIPVSGQMSITRPGYYYLTTDLIPTDTNMATPKNSSSTTPLAGGSNSYIVIRSSDVIFDGMGHTLDGKKLTAKYDSFFGMYLSHPLYNTTSYNVVIRNVTLSNWSSGIQSNHVNNFRLENSRFYHNEGGLVFQTSSGTVICQNIFSENYGVINGYDVENVQITDNIFTDNKGKGIALAGILEIPLQFKIFGKNYWLYSFHKRQNTTSGSGYVITRNTISNNFIGISLSMADNCLISDNNIQNSGGSGIYTRKVGNSIITRNIITGSRNYGILFENNGSTLVEFNNSLSGNKEGNTQTSTFTDDLPVSVILGLSLMVLWKVLFVGRKIEEGPSYQYIKNTFRSLEKKIKPVRVLNRTVTFLDRPVFISILGGIIFGGAFAYVNSVITVYGFLTLVFIGGIVTVTPRAVQYFTAQKNGLPLQYRMWWMGVFIIIVTSLFTTIVLGLGNVFGQPVRTDLDDAEKFNAKIITWTKLAGPFVCLLLSTGFFLLFITKGSYTDVARTGFKMSLLSAFVMLVPISPMEGEWVWKWNKKLWALLFFPVFIAYMFVDFYWLF